MGKAVNEKAEYFVLKINNVDVLIDMNEILDIIEVGSKKGVNKIIFKDGTNWTLHIEEPSLKKYEFFKKNIDNKKQVWYPFIRGRRDKYGTIKFH